MSHTPSVAPLTSLSLIVSPFLCLTLSLSFALLVSPGFFVLVLRLQCCTCCCGPSISPCPSLSAFEGDATVFKGHTVLDRGEETLVPSLVPVLRFDRSILRASLLPTSRKQEQEQEKASKNQTRERERESDQRKEGAFSFFFSPLLPIFSHVFPSRLSVLRL